MLLTTHTIAVINCVCCAIKSKTLSNRDLKKGWITREIISDIKKMQHYFILYCENKISNDFYAHFAKLDNQRNIIMIINSMLQETIYNRFGASSVLLLLKKVINARPGEGD